MNAWFEDEIKSIPAEVLADALHEASLRRAFVGFLDLYNEVRRGCNAEDIDEMIPWSVEIFLDKAERYNRSPQCSFGLNTARRVIRKIRENETIRQNPDLLKWGLLYAANSCSGSSSSPIQKIVFHIGNKLEAKGFDLDSLFY